MKKYRILFVLLLLPVLCACSADAIREEAALFWAEKGTIAELIRLDLADAPPSDSLTAAPAAADPGSARHLTCETHTELLPSFRSSADDPASVVSVDGVPLSDYPTAAGASEDERAGYLALPLFAIHQRAAVEAILSGFGLTAEWVERPGTAAAGEVFAIRYAGFSDESGYYVNPDVPVTLYVSAEKVAATARTGSNLVYLTFDDGPTKNDTVRLLDILDRYGVKGTFFTIGEAIRKYPDSAKAIVTRGHTLACHSMTHVYADLYASAASLEAEITAWESAVREAGIPLGEHGKLFRFPGGSVGKYLTDENRADMTAMLAAHGYEIFDWNIVTNDGLLSQVPKDKTTYQYLMENFLTTLDDALSENKGKDDAPLIVLMHEVTPETIDLMPWMIETFIDRGFTFGSLAERGSSWTFADRKN